MIQWVHQVASLLGYCEGVQSTAHPEATRDYISKSGKTKPPSGYNNFFRDNGMRLSEIKRRRDPKRLFSLASRVTWEKNPPKAGERNDSTTKCHDFDSHNYVDEKEGEANANSCHNSPLTQFATKVSSDGSTGSQDSSDSFSKDSENPLRFYTGSKRNLLSPSSTGSLRIATSSSMISDLTEMRNERDESTDTVSNDSNDEIRSHDSSDSFSREAIDSLPVYTGSKRNLLLASRSGSTRATDTISILSDLMEEFKKGSEGTHIASNDSNVEASKWSLSADVTDLSTSSDEEDSESVLTGNLLQTRFKSHRTEEGKQTFFPVNEESRGPASC